MKLKLELDSSSLWSANIQPTRPHCQLGFAPCFGNVHVCCCYLRCSGTGKRYSNRKESQTPNRSRLNAHWQTDWAIQDQHTCMHTRIHTLHIFLNLRASRINYIHRSTNTPSLFGAMFVKIDIVWIYIYIDIYILTYIYILIVTYVELFHLCV